MTEAKKSTIYIDAEDEITAIIEKVRAAHGSIVALVPPKRAPALQSVVNLKLLQRAAKTAKKNLVLVTTEPALLPLAGTVGLHVADTASSKPEIPPVPAALHLDDKESDVVESGEEPVLDPKKPIGELAGASTATAAATTVESIEVGVPSPTASTPVKKSVKADKKLKVPNFNKFRNKALLIGGGLVVLIILFVLANIILPSAHLVIKTDTTNVTSNLNVTASTSATEVDTDALVVPAVSKELKKTDSEKADATGQRDDGTKASGSLTLTNCIDDGESHTVPAGTGFSSGDKTFLTNKSVTLRPALYQGDTCVSSSFGFNQTVDATAAANGDGYNLGARSYSSPISGIQATGSDMSGGTSKIVKVVSQADVDGAKQKIMDRIKKDAESELKAQFAKENALAITDSLTTTDPVTIASPNVKSEGDQVNVSITVTYSEVGAKKDDLNKLIDADVQRQVDRNTQQMQDSGLDAAVLHLTSSDASGTKFQLQTVAVAGPKLDAEAIKKDVAGQKRGETTRRILARPGIKDVEISYSPFWVYSTPKNTGHITVTFEKIDGQQ